jgi:C1A family cysteine protease
MSRIYNLNHDIEDVRDFLLAQTLLPAVNLPSELDLRENCPPIWDQGNQGSCTSQAGCACRSMLTNDSKLELSRAFLYYQEREIEGKTSEDSGATIRDICKATQKFGICTDEIMPYDPADFATQPTPQAAEAAVDYKISDYKRLLSIDEIKQSLFTRSQPVLIGIPVYESMENSEVAASGILPMPQSGEKLLGGHAVLIVGYKNEKSKRFDWLINLFFKINRGYFIVRNSWGEGWGQKGYFLMPYDYLSKYGFDYWLME